MNINDTIRKELDAGAKVELDEFGLEWIVKSSKKCRACGSHYKRTNGGWGSICWECNEPWPDLNGR